jgi:hypothetical protein
MAKKVFLPLALALIGLTIPLFNPTPFTVRVIDEQTGLGVPSLRVTNADGMVRHTGTHGELIIWGKSSPLSTGERFEIQDERNQFVNVSATLRLTPGGRATVKVHRRA